MHGAAQLREQIVHRYAFGALSRAGFAARGVVVGEARYHRL